MRKHLLSGGAVLLMVVTTCASASDHMTGQRKQWQALAERGDAVAQYNLGMSYCCGVGPGKHSGEAIKWLCRAAARNKDAAFQLGQMYSGRPKEPPFLLINSRDIAYMWYTVAMQDGHPLAAAYRAALAQDMSEMQIARGERWAGSAGEIACP